MTPTLFQSIESLRKDYERQILGFFAQNPDEELTGQDILDKFDMSRTMATTIISRLLSAGELEIEWEDGEYTVRKAGVMA